MWGQTELFEMPSSVITHVGGVPPVRQVAFFRHDHQITRPQPKFTAALGLTERIAWSPQSTEVNRQ